VGGEGKNAHIINNHGGERIVNSDDSVICKHDRARGQRRAERGGGREQGGPQKTWSGEWWTRSRSHLAKNIQQQQIGYFCKIGTFVWTSGLGGFALLDYDRAYAYLVGACDSQQSLMEVVYAHAAAVAALPEGAPGAGQDPTASKLLAALVARFSQAKNIGVVQAAIAEFHSLSLASNERLELFIN
jgi:hypothetical protein